MDERLQKSGLCRIAITGPESTGKSQLAEVLAKHFNTTWVPEFARTYLEKLDRPYQFEDIECIAKGQLASEEAFAEKANGLLFCDTDCLVTKIWAEFKYGRCPQWIEDSFKSHIYDLYLLCDIDLPWEYDPLREHPDQRSILFNLYLEALKLQGLPYFVIKGHGDERSKNAINIINDQIIPKK